MRAKAKTQIFDGRTKEVVKLAVFAETDQTGQVFFKMEGQDGQNVFLMRYSYDLYDFLDLLMAEAEDILRQQEERL